MFPAQKMDKWAQEAIADFSESQNYISLGDAPTKDKRQSIFLNILTNKKLDDCEKQYGRLAQEAFVALVAGGETTARALTVATYHILANHERVLPRLQEELQMVMPERDTQAHMVELERLPWLVSISHSSCRTLRNYLLTRAIRQR